MGRDWKTWRNFRNSSKSPTILRSCINIDINPEFWAPFWGLKVRENGLFSVSARILLLCEKKLLSGFWFGWVWVVEFCVKWVGSMGLGLKDFGNGGFGCGILRVFAHFLISARRICFRSLLFSLSFPPFWIELLLMFQV